MANISLNFTARGNTAPLVTSLNRVQQAATRAMGGVQSSAVSVQAPINDLTKKIQSGSLGFRDWGKAIRQSSRIIEENNALVKASAVSYIDAAGNAKVYQNIIRGSAANFATFGQRVAYGVTVTRALGHQMIKTGKNIQWAGRQVMIGLTLPLAALATTATKTAEEYNKQMTRIVKVTNLSMVGARDEFGKFVNTYEVGTERMSVAISSIERQVERLSDIGASMGFLAADTSKVVAEFSQMGFAGFALDGVADAALRLSRVSGADLSDSMNLSRLAVMAFGKELGDGPDSLIQSFAKLNLIENQTSLSLAEMAGSIPIVAGVAKNLGIEVETLGGMLALMKDKGIEAREGATALRTGLIRLVQDATKPAVESFARLGVDIQALQEMNRGNVFGLINDLSHILFDFQNAGEGAAEKTEMFIAAIGKMVGTRAAARFTSMLEGMGKSIEKYTKVIDGMEIVQFRFIEGAEGVDKQSDAYRALGPAIDEANHAMKQFAFEEERVNKSLAGQAEILRAQLNRELQRFGALLLPIRNRIMEIAKNFLKAINDMDKNTKRFLGAFLGIIAVLGPATMIFGVLNNAIGQLLVIMTKLMPSMKLTTLEQEAQRKAFLRSTIQVNTATSAHQRYSSVQSSIAASTGAATAAIVAQTNALNQNAAAANRGSGRGAASASGYSRAGAFIGAPLAALMGGRYIPSLVRGAAKGSVAVGAALKEGRLSPSALQITRSQQFRAMLSEDYILSQLGPDVDASLLQDRSRGISHLQEIRHHASVDMAAQYDRYIEEMKYMQGLTAKEIQKRGRDPMEFFTQKGAKRRPMSPLAFFRQNMDRAFLVSAGVAAGRHGVGSIPGAPESIRQALSLPAHIKDQEKLVLPREIRRQLRSNYGINIGRRATMGQITDPGAKMFIEQAAAERRVGISRPWMSRADLRSEEEKYIATEIKRMTKSGAMADTKEARANKTREMREDLARTRGRAARERARGAYTGSQAPRTAFEHGLVAGRNAVVGLLKTLFVTPFVLMAKTVKMLIGAFKELIKFVIKPSKLLKGLYLSLKSLVTFIGAVLTPLKNFAKAQGAKLFTAAGSKISSMFGGGVKSAKAAVAATTTVVSPLVSSFKGVVSSTLKALGGFYKGFESRLESLASRIQSVPGLLRSGTTALRGRAAAARSRIGQSLRSGAYLRPIQRGTLRMRDRAEEFFARGGQRARQTFARMGERAAAVRGRIGAAAGRGRDAISSVMSSANQAVRSFAASVASSSRAFASSMRSVMSATMSRMGGFIESVRIGTLAMARLSKSTLISARNMAVAGAGAVSGAIGRVSGGVSRRIAAARDVFARRAANRQKMREYREAGGQVTSRTQRVMESVRDNMARRSAHRSKVAERKAALRELRGPSRARLAMDSAVTRARRAPGAIASAARAVPSAVTASIVAFGRTIEAAGARAAAAAQTLSISLYSAAKTASAAIGKTLFAAVVKLAHAYGYALQTVINFYTSLASASKLLATRVMSGLSALGRATITASAGLLQSAQRSAVRSLEMFVSGTRYAVSAANAFAASVVSASKSIAAATKVMFSSLMSISKIAAVALLKAVVGIVGFTAALPVIALGLLATGVKIAASRLRVFAGTVYSTMSSVVSSLKALSVSAIATSRNLMIAAKSAIISGSSAAKRFISSAPGRIAERARSMSRSAVSAGRSGIQEIQRRSVEAAAAAQRRAAEAAAAAQRRAAEAAVIAQRRAAEAAAAAQRRAEAAAARARTGGASAGRAISNAASAALAGVVASGKSAAKTLMAVPKLIISTITKLNSKFMEIVRKIPSAIAALIGPMRRLATAGVSAVSNSFSTVVSSSKTLITAFTRLTAATLTTARNIAMMGLRGGAGLARMAGRGLGNVLTRGVPGAVGLAGRGLVGGYDLARKGASAGLRGGRSVLSGAKSGLFAGGRGFIKGVEAMERGVGRGISGIMAGGRSAASGVGGMFGRMTGGVKKYASQVRAAPLMDTSRKARGGAFDIFLPTALRRNAAGAAARAPMMDRLRGAGRRIAGAPGRLRQSLSSGAVGGFRESYRAQNEILKKGGKYRDPSTGRFAKTKAVKNPLVRGIMSAGRAASAAKLPLGLGKLGAFAGGSALGAAATIAFPVVLALGTAAIANPEEFKKKLKDMFAAPLAFIKGAWDQLTSAVARLVYRIRALGSQGDGVGKKMSAIFGGLVGIIAGALTTAIAGVIAIITTAVDLFTALIALLQGDGAAAADILGNAWQRVKLMIAEAFLAVIDMISKIPGLGKLVDGVKDSIEGWVEEQREAVAEADAIQNALVDIDKALRSASKLQKEIVKEQEKSKEILDELVKFEIIQEETYKNLVDLVLLRGQHEHLALDTTQSRAKIEQNAIASMYEQITAMTELTDEQKTQVAQYVMREKLLNDLKLAEIDMSILQEEIQRVTRDGVSAINEEKINGIRIAQRQAEIDALIAQGKHLEARELARTIDNITRREVDRHELQRLIAHQAGRVTQITEQLAGLETEINTQLANRAQRQAILAAQAEAEREAMQQEINDAQERLQALRSAMGEVLGDIKSAMSKIVSDQAAGIKKFFEEINNTAKNYFDMFDERLSDQHDKLMDQIEQRADAEEQAINKVADDKISAIEDEIKKNEELDRKRQQLFDREQARIDFIRRRRVSDIQIQEAFLRGNVGEAAILEIQRRADVEEYYSDILKGRYEELAELRAKQAEEAIDNIEREREAALKANRERLELSRIVLIDARSRSKELSDLARERADNEIARAVEAAEKAREAEEQRIQNYLREWERVTPATEAEFLAHTKKLENFLDESGKRLSAEINKINNNLNNTLGEISADFQRENNSVVTTIRDNMKIVEDQYINTNNFILDEIAETTVEVANSMEDILAQFGSVATSSEMTLGNARDKFSDSINGMLSDLTISSERTFTAILGNDVPRFVEGLNTSFVSARNLQDAFFNDFARRMESGFAEAQRIAGATLAEERKWKEIGEQIARNIEAGYNKNRPNLTVDQPGVPGGAREGASGPGVTIPLSFWGSHTQPFNVNDLRRNSPATVAVRELQRRLNEVLGTRLAVDGNFGAATELAVMQAQGRIGAAQTGILTPAQYNRLMGSTFHSGGLVGVNYIPGLKKDEVSAVLQKGEYVMQRSAVARLGTDFMDRINNANAMFATPTIKNLSVKNPSSGSSTSVQNHYELSFQIDGGNIDEQALARKVVFEIKKMERNSGGGRRITS